MSTKNCDVKSKEFFSTNLPSKSSDNSIMMPMAQMSSLASSMMQSIAQQLQQTSMHPQSSTIDTLTSAPTNQNQIPDPNDPNPEILLALIARNKALEGKKTRVRIKFFKY